MTGARSWLGAVVLLGVAACGPGDAAISAPPDLDAGGSVVFAYRLGEELVLTAADASARPLFEAALPLDGALEVFALVYDTPLDSLDLTPGRVAPLDDPTTCGARALPAPARVHSVQVRAGARGLWQPAPTTLPPLVANVRLPGRCPCATFAIRKQERAEFQPKAAQITPDGLFLIAGNGRTGRLSGADIQYTSLSTTGVSGVQDLYVEPSGAIWVATRQGLHVGSLEGGFEEVARVDPAHGELERIAGGVVDGAVAVHGVTSLGTVLRLAPDVAEISQRRSGPAQSSQSARIARAPDGRVLASEAGSLELVLLDVASGRLERLPVRAESRGVQVIEHIEGLGFVAISELSRVYLLRDGEWGELPAPDRAPAKGVVRLGGGFVYSGDGGDLQEWHPEYGFCEVQQLPGLPRTTALHRVGDVLLTWGPEVGVGGGYLLTVLEIRP